MDKKGRGTDTKTLYKEKLPLNNLKKILRSETLQERYALLDLFKDIYKQKIIKKKKIMKI